LSSTIIVTSWDACRDRERSCRKDLSKGFDCIVANVSSMQQRWKDRGFAARLEKAQIKFNVVLYVDLGFSEKVVTAGRILGSIFEIKLF
jgi:hypothetical protein